ncbi:MoxR family ATPase [Eubacterium sp. 1001713B170207_170306_E7]|uniref:AAA family ATPase n=1 Tax=Eubacterium sp. 1001713B170207_170306_E7 TaxID=2787097 RepID=UPI001899F16B|nr:MoxR family ATPase [Eubacterium sp. 1001713B170207_170306_E7]
MNRIEQILFEINKVVVGKEPVVRKVLMAILARGHILLEDIPGVGKTTMALAFSRAMDLSYKRMQFTPDVMPSDVTGYTMFHKKDERFVYIPGAAMCNLFLADEINRTSSKTQSALLEVMEEGRMTVDGVAHSVPQPYIVIATQNPIGSAGTQPLPESQLDRFMVQLSLGYPDKKSEIDMLRRRQAAVPLEQVKNVLSHEDLLIMQQSVDAVFVSEPLYDYITDLVIWTRSQPLIRLGVSPRGTIALLSMAKACAFLHQRDFVTPKDVQTVFSVVCRHRLLLDAQARAASIGKMQLLQKALEEVAAPSMV